MVVVVAVSCMLAVSLLPARADAQQNDTCDDLRTVARLGPTTADSREPFRTTQDVFRVTYEVDFLDDSGTTFTNFDVEITDRFGLVESDSRDTDGGQSFLVPEDAGTYAIETDVEPENGARYTVVVEECAEDEGNGGGGGGDGPSDGQYDNEDGDGTDAGDTDDPADVDDPDDVVPGTATDEDLPDTGGLPLLATLFALALLVAGVALLGASVRRDP